MQEASFRQHFHEAGAGSASPDLQGLSSAALPLASATIMVYSTRL